MTDIVCNINAACPFKGGRFCKKEFLSITAAGQCSVWYDKAGNPRPTPYIQAETPVKTENETKEEENKEKLPQDNAEAGK